MTNFLSILLSSAFALSVIASDPPEERAETAKADTAQPEAVPAPAPEAKTAAADTSKKMRCKSVRLVDSRIPTRVCKTNEQWEEQERELREQMRGVRNRSSQCPDSGPC